MQRAHRRKFKSPLAEYPEKIRVYIWISSNDSNNNSSVYWVLIKCQAQGQQFYMHLSIVTEFSQHYLIGTIIAPCYRWKDNSLLGKVT